MTLELNTFHLNNKHKLVEGDKEGSDEVCSIGQDAGKQKVNDLQELAEGLRNSSSLTTHK